tara:strand:- start:128 stop:454 length:327 start_codon:yes stop_codon:yes gene_type:complete
MSIYERLSSSLEHRDVDTYVDLLHEEGTFVFHKSGAQYNKAEWSELASGALRNEGFVQLASRCLFETEDILVTHAFMMYPDGSKEAVMAVLMKKDEKIIRMETGCTPI